ncbi:MAG: TRAP transporter substrate-binding protein DctP [Proteobacteria bacterium]|nr:TRAP transporter substrate-binding protein DctP [Pseudomonadota bacterium]MBU1452069.1 TRAP transporter substrate-binding protein DctP [Pseudomonadota bacterium]MBU2467266.1 TRAP transporter substrate-binding protein DctP [Pseudomonadota bacterium]MBU2517351.1 TRAP transporter substrate-binding protein DctP [Pseudomonadota bacterium]
MAKRILVLMLALALGLGVFGSAAAKDKPIVWKMQASYPVGTAVMMHGVEWAKAIEKITNGRLKIEILPPGAMCGVKDIVNYLQKGMFDCAITYGGFYTGLIPETDLEIGLPQGHRSWDEVWDAMYNRGLGNVIQEAYKEHNIMWFPCAADCYYHFNSNFPIKSLEDLKGKKIRALGVYGKYVQKLGASPVVVPGAEMYMAMKLGTIDGAIYGASGLKDVKLMEVVKYYTLPTAAQIALSLLINRESIKKLPPDLRTIVETATPFILNDTSNRYITMCKASLAEAVNKGFTKINYLPEDEMTKMRTLVQPIWDELAAKSPRMKKGVDILKKQMKDLGRPMD